MNEYEKTLLATITRLETENAALRQQVDALSRALESDEYRALRFSVRAYAHFLHMRSANANLVIDAAIEFINATEAAKANAGAVGDGDGEAG